MKLWVNTVFKGFYPVGTAAVVVAEDAEDAAEYLNVFLCDKGLPPTGPERMVEMPFVEGQVDILCDGNY